MEIFRTENSPEIQALMETMINPNTKLEAVEEAALSLGDFKDERKLVNSFLIKQLGKCNPSIKGSIIYSLGKLKSKEAIPTLKNLLKDSDEDIRWVTVEALEKINVEETVPELIQCLEQESIPEIKAAIIRTLSNFNTEQILLTLYRYASCDTDSFVYNSAIKALEKIAERNKLSVSDENELSKDSDRDVAISHSHQSEMPIQNSQYNDPDDTARENQEKSTLPIYQDNRKINDIEQIDKADVVSYNSKDTDINTAWKDYCFRQRLEEQFSQKNGWVRDIYNLYEYQKPRHKTKSKSLKECSLDFENSFSNEEKEFIELADAKIIDNSTIQKMKMMLEKHHSEEWEYFIFDLSLQLAEINPEHPYASQKLYKKVVIDKFTFVLFYSNFEYPLNEKNMVLFRLFSYDRTKPLPPGINLQLRDIENNEVIARGEDIHEQPGLELFHTFFSESKLDLEIFLDDN